MSTARARRNAAASATATAPRPAAAATPSDAERLRADVLHGLTARVPTLPPKYFYDERGARLFEQISRLPEYYPTRTETRILETHATAMAAAIGPRARIVEFGSGSGEKTRILLRQLARPAEYVPIDISETQLQQFAADLRSEFPGLHVTPVAGDYTAGIVLPPLPPDAARTVAFFPGSTIGNFEEPAAAAFLRRVRRLCGRGGGLLIGADLHKDTATLELAYNDPQGVTAEFNLNVLRRINRECGADFPLDAFRHRAVYDPRRMRIEMRLECVRSCVVRMPLEPGSADFASFAFRAGDHIVTEYSHKYTCDSFSSLAVRNGWTVRRCWMDRRAWFSVWLLA